MSNAIANQLFLTYLGRPADAAWRSSTATVLNSVNPSAALQTAFYNAAISEGVFATTDSNSTLVNKVFLQTFGFAATTFEQTAWASLVTNGTVSRESLAWTIFVSYLGATNVPDQYKLPTQSKLLAVEAYTSQLTNDGAANLALSQSGAAATAARAQIATVTSQATAATFVTNIASNVSTSSVTSGQTFTLTSNVETLAGTTGNDTFNSTAATLQSFDNINGGLGDDTLNIAWSAQTAAFAVPASATIAGFENVNISNSGTNAGTNAVTVTNTTFGTGVKKFSHIEAGAGTTAAVSVTLASATDISVVSTGVTFTTAAITDTSTSVASTGSTLKNITLTKVNGAQTLTGNGINTLNLDTQATAVATITAAAGTRALTVNTAGTGGIIGVTDATATTLTLNNTGAQALGTFTTAAATTVNVSTTAAATGLVVTAAAATTLNISGTNTVAAVITGSTALTAINISGAGAGLTSVVDLSGIATNLATITSTATTIGTAAVPVGVVTLGATTVTAGFGTGVTFTGGAGNDTITVGATTKAINVGGGTNTVFLVSGTTALGAGGSITATTGTTDTLAMTNADAVAFTTGSATTGAALKLAVTGFETLDAGTATAAAVSMTAFGSFNEYAITTAAVNASLTGMTTGKSITATFGVAFNGTGLSVNALTGGTDTMTLNLKGDLSTGRAFGVFTTPGLELLTIKTVDSVTGGASTASTVTVVDTSLQSVTITGNNGLTLTNVSTVLNTVDASGLTKGAFSFTSAALTIDAIAKGSVVGGDTLNFALSVAKVNITATAGTNTLTGSSTVANTITGGTGADTIVGGSGIDTIVGGAGNDTITGGDLADILTGGAGADTFVLVSSAAAVWAANSVATTAGMDRITDFAAGTDKISLVNATVATTSVVLTSVTVATAADVAAILAGIGNSVAATVGGAQQVGVITVSAGAMAGSYLFANDLVNAASALDTLINITGVSGTIATGDFTLG